jgi:hypothetical protein
LQSYGPSGTPSDTGFDGKNTSSVQRGAAPFNRPTNASVGPTADAQTYWGLAFDAGGQHVFPGGFTLGAGLGLGFVHMADASAFFPRILLQMGWSL